MNLRLLQVSIVLLVCTAASTLSAASIEKATMLHKHGLTRETKAELIDVIFGDSAGSAKAAAYYLLGSIAFEEDRIAASLDTWRELTEKYPTSEQAILVKDRINELAGVVGESVKENIENSVALSYLRHGDFWSKGKDEIFTIDARWIPNVETAIKWYDEIIREFPKSTASEVAYKRKLWTLLGWKDPGSNGSKYGIEYSFAKYMRPLQQTFSSFEIDHPESSSLQAFRYQIAQVYWKNRYWADTRVWLNLIIEKSGNSETFYRDLATRRLEKVEY
jgi:tetratricopeptide (TPR) repeat protein